MDSSSETWCGEHDYRVHGVPEELVDDPIWEDGFMVPCCYKKPYESGCVVLPEDRLSSIVMSCCVHSSLSTHYRGEVVSRCAFNLIKLQRALDTTDSLADLRDTPLGGCVAHRGASREALPGSGVLGNSSGNTASVQQPGALVEVVDIVTGLVVVLVKDLASNTAPDLLLCLGLDLISASGGAAVDSVGISCPVRIMPSRVF